MEFMVGGAPRRIDIASLVIAGWTGRDKAAVEHHIAELAAIGVKRPRAIPCFYRLGADFLTPGPRGDAVGGDPGGGQGFRLVAGADAVYRGGGPGHTEPEVRGQRRP